MLISFRVVSFIIGCTFFLSARAQTPDPPSENSCEQVTQAALPRLVSLLERNDYAQINQVLETIENVCGVSELTQRVRIVNLMIQKENTDEAIHLYLRQYFDEDLIDRLEAAADDGYADIYINDREAFDFVPLRHSVDSLIIQKSAAMLGSNMYELNDAEETIAFLFSDHIGTYLSRMDEEIPTSGAIGTAPQPSQRVRQHHASEIYKDRIGFILSGGVYTPADAVNPVFRTSPIFGFAVSSPLSRDWIFDGFFKYKVNTNSREFEYLLYNDVEWVESRYSMMIGGSAGYKFLDLGRFLMIGKGAIAFEGVETGLSEVISDGWGGAAVIPHTVNTYNLAFGVSALQHIAGRTFAGLQVQYHYSPYNNHRNLLTPIASDYISVEFSIRF